MGQMISQKRKMHYLNGPRSRRIQIIVQGQKKNISESVYNSLKSRGGVKREWQFSCNKISPFGSKKFLFFFQFSQKRRKERLISIVITVSVWYCIADYPSATNFNPFFNKLLETFEKRSKSGKLFRLKLFFKMLTIEKGVYRHSGFWTEQGQKNVFNKKDKMSSKVIAQTLDSRIPQTLLKSNQYYYLFK